MCPLPPLGNRAFGKTLHARRMTSSQMAKYPCRSHSTRKIFIICLSCRRERESVTTYIFDTSCRPCIVSQATTSPFSLSFLGPSLYVFRVLWCEGAKKTERYFRYLELLDIQQNSNRNIVCMPTISSAATASPSSSRPSYEPA